MITTMTTMQIISKDKINIITPATTPPAGPVVPELGSAHINTTNHTTKLSTVYCVFTINVYTQCATSSPGILSQTAVLSERDGGGVVHSSEGNMIILLYGNNYTIFSNTSAIWEPPFWLSICFTIIRVTLNGLQVTDQH